jgi:monoamine oxidase
MRACNKSILKTLKLADQMLLLAHEGESVQEDTGCGILYGVLKDSAFKIKGLAEKERVSHIRKGWWKEGEGGEGDGTI